MASLTSVALESSLEAEPSADIVNEMPPQWTADPRHAISKFFQPGDNRGPLGYLRSHNQEPVGEKSEFFTIWRPTSAEAIGKMMNGDGCGKSLNIKGKSAKTGLLSGYVPFLQICDNDHKVNISTDSSNAVRMYFSSEKLRSDAIAVMEPLKVEMTRLKNEARENIEKLMTGEAEFDECGQRKLDELLKLHMGERPRMKLIDKFSPKCFGLEVPERLLWEAYVKRQDISRSGEYVTGRPSSAPFMTMNLHSLREADHPPKVVIWQHDTENAMNSLTLLMAYEEEMVRPVVSDFDPFLVGSKNVTFETLPPEQTDCMLRLIERLQYILNHPHRSESWTQAWLSAKEHMKYELHEHLIHVSSYGLGDPTTTSFIESCCEQFVCDNGAVRHGAECFNFTFPQEIDDDNMLVVWEGLPPEDGDGDDRWKVMNRTEIVNFLHERIKEGYVFPLNPKWVLCDEGYYDLWRELNDKPGNKEKLDSWFPSYANIVEKIEAVREKYPNGFSARYEMDKDQQETMYAKAELEKKLKGVIRRARFKLRMILIFLHSARKKNPDACVRHFLGSIRASQEMEVSNIREAVAAERIRRGEEAELARKLNDEEDAT